MNIFVYLIGFLILIYIYNKFKIFDFCINTLKKFRNKLLKFGNITYSIYIIILCNITIIMTSYLPYEGSEIFKYILYFSIYLFYITNCMGIYNLLERIISYLLVSIISSTIFFCYTYNIPILDSFYQSFGLTFLYTNFVVSELTKCWIVFINYMFNFIICSYIILDGIKTKKIK